MGRASAAARFSGSAGRTWRSPILGARACACGKRDHRGRTRFAGDGERVFCHPLTGGALDHKRYAGTFRAVLAKANVRGDIRPFHDMRHTSITNAAAAGTPPAALMARAGHSDFKTTQGYIDLAGETFREEADRLEERVFASLSRCELSSKSWAASRFEFGVKEAAASS